MRTITLCFFLVSPVSYAATAALPNDAAATAAPVKKPSGIAAYSLAKRG
ncbi:hypothetical protein [Serratia marcescens]|nr:hypothetical protein Q9K10_11860 [Serratia marcescens]